jgi:hypothetical protein
MGWGEITLYFYVPMFPWKDFFDGKDWENTKKHKEERDRYRKIQKNKKERMEERKRRDFLHTWRFPYYF